MLQPGASVGSGETVRRRVGRFAGFALTLGALAGCATAPEPLPIEAYLAPPPLWRGLPPPAPVPALTRNVQVVGMGSGDLRSVFGEPALVRVEGNVQYWRYTFAGCSLDLFVDARPERQPAVVHYSLRPEPLNGNGKAASECERLARRLDSGQQRIAPERELPRVESF